MNVRGHCRPAQLQRQQCDEQSEQFGTHSKIVVAPPENLHCERPRPYKKWQKSAQRRGLDNAEFARRLHFCKVAPSQSKFVDLEATTSFQIDPSLNAQEDVMGLFDKLFSGHHGGGRGHHGGNYRDSDHNRGYGDGSNIQRPANLIACPSCGGANQPGARFCQQCGTSMVATQCAKCSTVLAPNARFCGSCGQGRG